MSDFTHFNEAGEAVMVDVSGKPISDRCAVATGTIYMSKECFNKVINHEMNKGDVLNIARIAGIMGAKRTSELIPLCHNIVINSVEIDFETDATDNCIIVKCTAKCNGVTGVEMEALTGVQICLLTIYDMCKAVDKRMRMENIHLCSKSGGKSGDFAY